MQLFSVLFIHAFNKHWAHVHTFLDATLSTILCACISQVEAYSRLVGLPDPGGPAMSSEEVREVEEGFGAGTVPADPPRPPAVVVPPPPPPSTTGAQSGGPSGAAGSRSASVAERGSRSGGGSGPALLQRRALAAPAPSDVGKATPVPGVVHASRSRSAVGGVPVYRGPVAINTRQVRGPCP